MSGFLSGTVNKPGVVDLAPILTHLIRAKYMTLGQNEGQVITASSLLTPHPLKTHPLVIASCRGDLNCISCNSLRLTRFLMRSSASQGRASPLVVLYTKDFVSKGVGVRGWYNLGSLS